MSCTVIKKNLKIEEENNNRCVTYIYLIYMFLVLGK